MPEVSLAELKSQLVEHYRWLRQYGCNDSHSGNASLRWHNQVWVTPTGCCADTLTPEMLVACDFNGQIDEAASLDAALHLATYQNNPQAGAIFHSHDPHAITMTLDGQPFIPIDFEGQYYFPQVAVLTIDYADYLQLSPSMVAQALREHKVVIVRGRGVYSCAETVNIAYKWSCSVELSAKIAWLAAQR